MILPILIYGHPLLRKRCLEIEKFSNSNKINSLIKNMYDTMGKAQGIGLAAPQIGISLRLFIIEYNNFYKKKFKQVFINPKILKIYGSYLITKEGCLSIPNILENIIRKNHLILEYYDENWKKYKQHFNGLLSIIIQHEYDHIEGKFFLDHISDPKKLFLHNQLKKISAKINPNPNNNLHF
ncbi:MAG: peptide deformylase [Candidatus Karelsulcia muelleri]|uniref:peptide deformylase n=1 Tax=Candidatus Karelsulcia muelleri TaxID=336810 RepID=UPI000D7BC97B|nr:peptide deformylase [Candidatus Karelsulcia muelleri]